MRARISPGWQLIIAFFEGAALSLIAYDLSDYAFYSASARGALSPMEQAFYYAVFPTLLYLGLAMLSWYLARSGKIDKIFFLFFFLALVILTPTIAGLFLPQASSLFYSVTIILGAAVSVIITVGLIRQVRRAR